MSNERAESETVPVTRGTILYWKYEQVEEAIRKAHEQLQAFNRNNTIRERMILEPIPEEDLTTPETGTSTQTSATSRENKCKSTH